MLVDIPIEHTQSGPIHLAAYDGHHQVIIALLKNGAQLFAKNKFGDTFFHIAIRHGQEDCMKEVLNYIDSNMTLEGEYPFDIENYQEKCTPYTLALLREQFTLAELFLENDRSDIYFKNTNGENVFDIAKRLNIKNVQKFLVK